MELANSNYPMRTLIKCKAKMQLQSDPAIREQLEPVDEGLFADLALTVFQANRPLLHQGYRTPEGAAEVEDRLAEQLAHSYQTIKLNQTNPVVQQLNALL